MMRLLFLCLLLLLPAAVAVSEDVEGSVDDDDINDDEDFGRSSVTESGVLSSDSAVDKATGVDETNQLTLIVIVVAVTVLSLSVAAIVAVVLVRRKMHNRQQGIYSVPTEQDQKGAV